MSMQSPGWGHIKRSSHGAMRNAVAWDLGHPHVLFPWVSH